MKLASILALAPALIAAAPATPDIGGALSTGPAPGTVQIENVVYGGTGCPQGTVATTISNDHTTMTMLFDAYVASLGPGVPVTENRKNCQININLHYPGGFQYSVFSADYRGY